VDSTTKFKDTNGDGILQIESSLILMVMIADMVNRNTIQTEMHCDRIETDFDGDVLWILFPNLKTLMDGLQMK